MIGAFKLLSPKVIKGILKYVFEDNKLDITVRELKSKVRDLEQKVTDIGFKVTATVDMIKGYAETIDNIADKVKGIDKVIDKFDGKLKQIDKIAHPPAIPLKEINEFSAMKNEFKGIKDIINKMKKITLLRSLFK